MPTITAVTDEAILGAADRFFRQPDIASCLSILTARLPLSADIYVAGGAIRNIVMDSIHGSAPPTADIDMFIGGLDRGFSLSEALKGEQFEPTDLKGIRWHPEASDLVFDLCLLTDFLVIDAYHLDPTVENFLSGIDFTCNAILYGIPGRELLEKGCTEAVARRLIEFNSRLIPDEGLIAYRILLLAHKTGFCLSKSVFRFVKDRLPLETLIHIKELLRAKMGKTVASAVMGKYDALCRYPSYAAYCADQAGNP
ncbi:MAG: hypothetical protein PVF20_08400 [Desulfobacterales bacterium]|jgi:hypothetical protein